MTYRAIIVVFISYFALNVTVIWFISAIIGNENYFHPVAYYIHFALSNTLVMQLIDKVMGFTRSPFF
jgi:hypothetical protein